MVLPSPIVLSERNDEEEKKGIEIFQSRILLDSSDPPENDPQLAKAYIKHIQREMKTNPVLPLAYTISVFGSVKEARLDSLVNSISEELTKIFDVSISNSDNA